MNKLPIFLLIVLLIFACRTSGNNPSKKIKSMGFASYYHDSLHGKKTASGERYDRDKLTAAHKSLPFGTRIRVSRIDNGKSVNVRINDRGPFIEGRIVDLSRKAAKRIDLLREGITKVRIEVIN